MDASIDNLIIEHLEGLRSEVQTLRSEMHSEFRDVKQHPASVETTIVAAQHEAADLRGDSVRRQVSLDSLLERSQRIEKRLERS